MSEVNIDTRRNNTPAMTAVLVLLIVLLGTMSYLWYAKNSALNEAQNKIKELEANLEEMNKMMTPFLGEGDTDDLMTDFKNMISDYDKLMKEGRPEDQAAMQEQQDKIKGLLGDLESAKKRGKVDALLISKLRKENETLRQIMIGYVKQIDELNTKNLQLTSDLDRTSAELSDTKSERDNYKADAEEKGEKVKQASKLTTYGFRSTGLRMKLNDQTEPTTKARNCVQAVSNFTIGDNAVAAAGARTVYLQIIDPDGKALQGRSGGTTSTDNGTVVYSAKREIQYANKAIDVAIYFDFNGEEPVKGNYKVKIFCDGALIGTDSFTLK
jgi:hypothetical protein